MLRAAGERQFSDRHDAGERLARALTEKDLDDPVVLALPRGGVPVAFEIARSLDAPLDVFVARKIGAPGHCEYGIGAIAEGDVVVFDSWAVQALRLTAEHLDELRENELVELQRRVRQYRGDRALPSIAHRDVVLVDDGLATGVTAEAAVRALRTMNPRRVMLAVPACAPESRDRLAELADEVVCLMAPAEFRAVGQWYERFDQTTDEQVADLLAARREEAGPR